jgi:hypothetical protein
MEDRATLGSDLSAMWDFAESIALYIEIDTSVLGVSVCFSNSVDKILSLP